MPILKKTQHERFCREYVIDHNATQAATRAGYSSRSAYAQGYSLMHRPEVQARIAELEKKALSQVDITAERVILELARLAFHDPRKLFDVDGNLKAVHTIDDDTAAAVSSMEFDEPKKGKKQGPIRKIRTAGKEAALRMLAQRFKLIGSDADEALTNMAVAFADRVSQARLRRKA